MMPSSCALSLSLQMTLKIACKISITKSFNKKTINKWKSILFQKHYCYLLYLACHIIETCYVAEISATKISCLQIFSFAVIHFQDHSMIYYSDLLRQIIIFFSMWQSEVLFLWADISEWSTKPRYVSDKLLLLSTILSTIYF